MKKKLDPKPYMFPKPVALVGAMVKGKPNFNVIVNTGIACFDPPMVWIACDKDHYTNIGIRKNRTFSINVPSSSMAQKVDYCGIYSGKSDDKSSIFKVFFGDLGSAPMIVECPINLECRVERKMKFGEEEIFIGEIVAVYADGKCMKGDKPSIEKIDPLIYSTADKTYYLLGKSVGRAFSIGAKKKL